MRHSIPNSLPLFLSCIFWMLLLVHAPELLRILMTASSATARLLSLAVLILSLAPLASLYVAFFSILGMDPTVSPILLVENGNGNNGVTATWTTTAAAAGGGIGGNENNNVPFDWTQLTSNRTALGELWKAVYKEAAKRQPEHPLLTSLGKLADASSSFYPTTATSTMGGGGATATAVPTILIQQHWTIVLPWLLTFILGVVVPLVLSLWSFCRQYRHGRWQSSKRRRKDTLKALQAYSKVLSHQDQVVVVVGGGLDEREANVDDTRTTTRRSHTAKEKTSFEPGALSSSCSTSDTTASTIPSRPAKATPATIMLSADDEASVETSSRSEQEDETTTQETVSQWKLPLPGQVLVKNRSSTINRVPQNHEQQQQSCRNVPGLCVVCLNPYQVKERVTWSANPSCVHCFHTDCIAKWLVRQSECPCCRRVFSHKIPAEQGMK